MADNSLFLPKSFDRVQAQDVTLKCNQFYNVPMTWENSIGVQLRQRPHVSNL